MIDVFESPPDFSQDKFRNTPGNIANFFEETPSLLSINTPEDSRIVAPVNEWLFEQANSGEFYSLENINLNSAERKYKVDFYFLAREVNEDLDAYLYDAK